MADTQRINGVAYSWTSMVIKFDGQRFTGLTSVSFADKLEVGLGYGQGRHFAPLARTAGKYSCDDSKITMRVSSWSDFQAYLMPKSPDGLSYGFAEFDVDVQYVEPAPDLATRPMHVVLVKNRIIGVSHSVEQSTDEATAELTLSTLYITRNNGTLFDSSRGFPG